MGLTKEIELSAYAGSLGLTVSERNGVLETRHGSGIRQYLIESSDGARLGDLYGLVLPPRAGSAFVIEGDRIHMTAPVADFRDLETLLLDRMRGTFAVVTGGKLAPRLYPDCASTLPIVYCPESRRAGASAATILGEEEYWERYLALRHRLHVERRALEAWIPGTLTAHQGVYRLLPNHYLDLDTWSAVRFWPRPKDFRRDAAGIDTASIVAAEVSEFIAAAASEHRVGVALTAGYDSRLMAAACRGVANRLDFYTLAHDRPGMDAVVAGDLSRRLGLRHEVVPFVEATREEQDAWDRATGHTIRHANRRLHPSVRQLDCDLIVTGILGETGRSRMYKNDFATVDEVKPRAEAVLARMNVPAEPEVLEDIETWLAGIDWLPFSAILDLAVLELFYMPHFRPPQFAQMPELMPFADRAVQNAFFATPPQEKPAGRLFKLAIEELWPEALSIPVNRYGDYRDIFDKVNKLSQPDRVIPYVQRRLGEGFWARN